MAKQRINIPSGTLTNEEIEMIAGKLVMCGYAVGKGKYKKEPNKGVRYLEYGAQEGDADGTC
jgi:methyl coenzyme M reductase subunit D